MLVQGGGSFRGLFIGLDKYLTDSALPLSFAAHDAASLRALLCDYVPEHSHSSLRLLTNESASRREVVRELELLHVSSTEDDVVVVMFSGHGTNAYELNLYDEVLAMSDFVDLLSGVRARQLLVVLDCCFAGGVLAKTVRTSRHATESVESVVRDHFGGSRYVITACGEDEEAIEDPRSGHGLLTGRLLEEMCASPDGPRSLHDVLQAVRRSVIGRALACEKRQTPLVVSELSDGASWPILLPGRQYSALVGAEAPAPATTSPESLLDHGVPAAALQRWREEIHELMPIQVKAVNDGGVLRGGNVLAVAPTSSGKTLVGELAALRAARRGGRTVFLLPTRALVDEQFDRFAGLYGEVGLGVVQATGESGERIPAILDGRFTIAVMTYEICAGLAVSRPELLEKISVVVVDEIQTIAEPGRGATLEFLLTAVLAVPEQRRPQIVGLSAVLPDDFSELDGWLDARGVRDRYRPVPLVRGTLDPAGRYRFLDTEGAEAEEQLVIEPPSYDPEFDAVDAVVREAVRSGQQVVIFRNTRRRARDHADRLAKTLGLPPARVSLPPGEEIRARSFLKSCLRGGVAVHSAEFSKEERRAVERAFRERDSGIRVLVATTTLAKGVNLPAETVVVVELHHDGEQGSRPYSVGDLQNMAGRAGRRGQAGRGRAIIPVAADRDAEQDIWDRYLLAPPGRVRSVLLDGSTLPTVLLRVIALLQQHGRRLRWRDVMSFLSRSFAAHQIRMADPTRAIPQEPVLRTLTQLMELGFLHHDDENLELTALGGVVSRGSLDVRSAMEVVRVLRALRPEEVTAEVLVAASQLTVELDASARLGEGGQRSRPPLYFTHRLRELGLPQPVVDALEEGSHGRERCKRVIACVTWARNVPLPQVESSLAAAWSDPGPVRQVVLRTRDVIETVIAVAAQVHPGMDLRAVELLPAQLDFGVSRGLAAVALHAGGRLTRSHWLGLLSNGVDTSAAILGAEDELLASSVGSGLVPTLRTAAELAVDTEAAPL